jgi:acetyl esterase
MLQKFKIALLRGYYRGLNAWAWRRGAANGVETEDLEIQGPGGALALRIYRPASEPERCVLYFHGGGWALGDLETHHPFCTRLCRETGSLVAALHYRRAPEHPFPAAVDDCLAAVDWALGTLARESVSAEVFVGGDSAGGNLAAVVANLRRAVAGQLLIYPVTAHYVRGFPSYQQYARGHGLTRSLMVQFWDSYLAGAEPESAAPLSAPLEWTDLSGLPPALLITAEFDPLKDEGIRYAGELAAAGVPTMHRHFAAARHGFLCSEGASADHRDAMGLIAGWLRGDSTLD